MAIILAAGGTAADSSTFTVADAPVTLTLVPPTADGFPGQAAAEVIRLVGGVEISLGTLATRPAEERSKVLVAAGSYIIRRAAGHPYAVDAS